MATVPTIIADIMYFIQFVILHTHCGSITMLAVPDTVDGDNSATTVDGSHHPISGHTHYLH